MHYCTDNFIVFYFLFMEVHKTLMLLFTDSPNRLWRRVFSLRDNWNSCLRGVAASCIIYYFFLRDNWKSCYRGVAFSCIVYDKLLLFDDSNYLFVYVVMVLKVHKIENFFGSDFEFCVIFIVSYAQILRFCKNIFWSGHYWGRYNYSA